MCEQRAFAHPRRWLDDRLLAQSESPTARHRPFQILEGCIDTPTTTLAPSYDMSSKSGPPLSSGRHRDAPSCRCSWNAWPRGLQVRHGLLRVASVARPSLETCASASSVLCRRAFSFSGAIGRHFHPWKMTLLADPSCLGRSTTLPNKALAHVQCHCSGSCLV